MNARLEELQKDRIKIMKRKKTQKYIKKRLQKNSFEKFKLIVTALNQTAKHFKSLYYESNRARRIKLRKIQEGIFWDEIPEEKETLISIALKALYHIRQKQKKAREIIAEKKKQQKMGDDNGKSP